MMVTGKLSPAERRRYILEKVKQAETISTSEILKEFKRYGIKPTTIANDLKLLVSQGFIEKKSHGSYGLPLTVPMLFGPGKYSDRLSVQSEEKAAIAKYIAKEYLSPDQIIGIDSGTTATAIFREIISKEDLKINVITNNLHGVYLLSSRSHIKCTIVGGRCDSEYAAIVGPMTEYEESRRIEIGVLGVSGVFESTDSDGLVENGLTTKDDPQWPFKRWLALKSELQIVAADHSKIGRARGDIFISLSQLKNVRIVTDSNTDSMAAQQLQHFKESLKRFGDRIVMVDPDGTPGNEPFRWKSGKPDTIKP